MKVSERTRHVPGCQHQSPVPGSRGYIRVVARGCGGRWFETQYGREFDCIYGYTWSCDECPINRESPKFQEPETDAVFTFE